MLVTGEILRAARILRCGLVIVGIGTAPAFATNDVLRVGVLADMSGIYSDMTGAGSVRSVELAVADFGGSLNGRRIEVLSADHQNKSDIAVEIARRWYSSGGVDVIVNVAGSAVALSVAEIAKQQNKALLVTGALSDRLSNEACSVNHVHYGIDSYAMAKGTVDAVMGQGKKSWYFLVVDYAFGHSMFNQASGSVVSNDGTVVGAVRHPLNTSDFASYLLQAQASKAQAIGLANAGPDTVKAIAQAQEFGITGGAQSVVAMAMQITDIHAMGLDKAQNIELSVASYWDNDDESRAFAERFYKAISRMPTFYHEADYSATLAYLNSAKTADTKDGKAVIAGMRGKPINDFFARGGVIREDGLLVHDILLTKVKTPGESKKPWDYLKILSTIPGEKAFRPLSESKCPIIAKN